MPRVGAEPKPAWQAVPRAVRQEVAATLGAPVERAARVWGGYAPSPTFRLKLSDGRRAFFKGVDTTSNEYMRQALAREERVYRELADVISPWAPAFYGSFRRDDWHVLLLQDVGPASVPPWTPGKSRAAIQAYAEFQRTTLSVELPDWLARDRHHRFGRSWRQFAAEPSGLESLAALAGSESKVARRWLGQWLPRLAEEAENLAHAPPPDVLLHFDTRSDNIRLADGRLCLFDWPYAAVGPAEFDTVAFVQSITAEGGPEPERIMAWYSERLLPREPVVRASVAAIAGYFADAAWRPELPGLPRLRSIQRRQLRASLAWAARQLGLPEPTWLREVKP